MNSGRYGSLQRIDPKKSRQDDPREEQFSKTVHDGNSAVIILRQTYGLLRQDLDLQTMDLAVGPTIQGIRICR